MGPISRVPPSPLTEFGEFVVAFWRTYWHSPDAQTRTMLARLRRASCLTDSSRSVLRLAKQWKSLSALRGTSSKSGSSSRNGNVLRGSIVSVRRVTAELMHGSRSDCPTFLIIENRKCTREQWKRDTEIRYIFRIHCRTLTTPSITKVYTLYMSNLYFSLARLGVRLITLMRQLIDLMISM